MLAAGQAVAVRQLPRALDNSKREMVRESFPSVRLFSFTTIVVYWMLLVLWD